MWYGEWAIVYGRQHYIKVLNGHKPQTEDKWTEWQVNPICINKSTSKHNFTWENQELFGVSSADVYSRLSRSLSTRLQAFGGNQILPDKCCWLIDLDLFHWTPNFESKWFWMQAGLTAFYMWDWQEWFSGLRSGLDSRHTSKSIRIVILSSDLDLCHDLLHGTDIGFVIFHASTIFESNVGHGPRNIQGILSWHWRSIDDIDCLHFALHYPMLPVIFTFICGRKTFAMNWPLY